MNSSPCAKFTTSMMPKIRVRPEATNARIMPVTTPFTVWIRICSNAMPMLHAQILVDHCVAYLELGCRSMVSHCSLLHQVDSLANLQRQRHILLYQQDRHAFTVQRVDDLMDVRHHPWHQSFGRFVQQDDPGLQHHRAGYGEHLLLAAGERAARLVASLRQHRKGVVDLVQKLPLPRFRYATPLQADAEVLHHGQERKDAPVLGHVTDTETR